MPTDDIIGALVHTQRQVDGLSRQPLHACGGTWRHNATQTVGIAGATLQFNTEIRNSGITVDATGTQFTVNTGGMFVISLALAFNVGSAGHLVYMSVNGVYTDVLIGNSFNTPTGNSSIFMKYLQKNHVLSFFLDPSTTIIVQSTTEDALNESPILQIAQVSPKFTGS